MPLFMLIFALVPLGVVVGGIAAWLRQHKWRMRARRAEAEARDLRDRLDADQPRRNVPALEASPPFAVPPAASRYHAHRHGRRHQPRAAL